MNYHRHTRRSVLLSGMVAALALLGPAIAAGADAPPFSIHKRPMPTGQDLVVLLPAAVGDFKRDALPSGARLAADEDLNVTYRHAGDTVTMGLSKPETVEDAREAIKVTRDEAVASKIPMRDAKYSVKTEPAYFHVGDFVAWTRGQYFFYAKANSPAALSRFMAAFSF